MKKGRKGRGGRGVWGGGLFARLSVLGTHVGHYTDPLPGWRRGKGCRGAGFCCFPTGTLQRTLTGHTADVTCVAISLEGAFIISGSIDSTVRVWGQQSGVLRGWKERPGYTGFEIRTQRRLPGHIFSWNARPQNTSHSKLRKCDTFFFAN